GQHFITNSICLGITDKTRLRNQRRMLQKRAEQGAAAANKDDRVGAQIHLKLAKLVENAVGMHLCTLTDRFLDTVGQDGFPSKQNSADMLIFNFHVMLSTD